MNNVNTKEVQKFAESVKNDSKLGLKSFSVGGSWVFEEGKPQFVSTVEYANGKEVLNAEIPDFVGGWGNSLDALQYCLFGLAACFASTFMLNATKSEITLTKLEVTAENFLDMNKMLGFSEDDIVQKVKFNVTADGLSEEQLNDLIEVSKRNCPGVDCLSRPIPIEVEIIK